MSNWHMSFPIEQLKHNAIAEAARSSLIKIYEDNSQQKKLCCIFRKSMRSDLCISGFYNSDDWKRYWIFSIFISIFFVFTNGNSKLSMFSQNQENPFNSDNKLEMSLVDQYVKRNFFLYDVSWAWRMLLS